MDYPALNFATN